MNDERPRHRGLVSDSARSRVLVEADGDAWRLPAHQFTDALEINAELRNRLGTDVVTTGCVRLLGDVHDESAPWVFGHWQHGDDTALRPGVRWIDQSEVDTLPFTDAEDRETVRGWFAEKSRGVTPLGGLPWAHHGWFDEVSGWCLERLAAEDRAVTGPVEQRYASPWSSVLRVPTSTGAVYFKAVVPGFGHEPRLTEVLATWFPGEVPTVLAADETRGWLLTEDFGPFTEMVPDDDNVERFEQAVRQYARLQQHAAEHVDELVAMGCPDRRLAAIPALFEELLADTAILRLSQDGGITEEEHDTLRTFASRLPDLCARLESYGLPETVVNNDFWHGNLAFTDTGTVYYDWSEAVVAHPLASLRIFLFCVEHFNPDSVRVRERLLDAYLASWEHYATPARLAEAYQLAQPIAYIARALCWRANVTLLEPERRFLMAFSVPNNMKDLAEWARKEL